MKMCWRQNETPTLQSGLNLSVASCSCFILYLLHNNLQGKLPSTMIQRLYSAQVRGEITFTLTYLLQLRLCFENFLINLESILSLGLFLLRNQRNILVCKKCSFPTGTNRGFWAVFHAYVGHLYIFFVVCLFKAFANLLIGFFLLFIYRNTFYNLDR